MPDGDGVHIAPGELGLTARQADVLKLLVQGKPNKLICRDLTLSEGTVKVHVSAILKALRVHSRTRGDRRARAPRHQRRHAGGATAGPDRTRADRRRRRARMRAASPARAP